MSEPLKLLIVDDSQLIREAITAIFDVDDDVEVVGEAANGREALEAIERLRPDVVTLDINMPVMDGLQALKHIMIKFPTPVLMLSSLTLEGAKVTFDALRYGAVDFIPKPSKLDEQSMHAQADMIRNKVHTAAKVEVSAVRYIRPVRNNAAQLEPSGEEAQKVVSLGAAEGGYSPLMKIIPHLAVDGNAAYLAVLYAEQEYVDAFADYINEFSAVKVKRAVHGEPIKAGVCYISAGQDYMTVHRDDNQLVLHVSPAPFSFRKGSVDRVLFSAADTLGENVVGVILSGLGNDGAEGMEAVVRMSGNAIVQEPHSCLCKEMPETAREWNSQALVLPDHQIADMINGLVS